MKKLNELRQQRAKLNSRNADLVKMMEDHPDDTDKRPGKLTDEQCSAEYDANDVQIKALDAEITTLEKKNKDWADRKTGVTQRQAVYAGSAGLAVPATGLADPEEDDDENGGEGDSKIIGGGRRKIIQVKPMLPGVRMAKVLRAVGALHIGKKDVALQILADIPEAKTAMEAGNFSSGGAWIPEHYVAEMIELLRPMSVVMSMGVSTAPLVNGTLTLPKITGGATAAYIGESQNIGTSSLTGGQVKATAHKLAVMVPISNDLLRYAVPSADVTVRNDMLRAASQTRDAAQIRDDGTGNAPKGLRYWAPSGQVETMTATPDLTKVDRDLNLLITNLLAANVFSMPRQTGTPQSEVVEMTSVGWLMSPRTWSYLTTLRDGNGNRAFPEMIDGMLKGFPFAVSSQIPENLGGGTESEVYFVAFSDVVVAQDPRVELEVSNVAAYHDGSNVQAAFSLDQTVLRLIMNDDLIVRHSEAVSVLTGVTWGV